MHTHERRRTQTNANTNNCRKIRENLHDYAAGQTDENLSLEIERHLSSCEECRRLYEAEKLYCRHLPQIADALSTPPRDLKSAVMARIKEDDARPAPIKKRRLPVFSYGTAAALVLVAALLIFSYRNGMTDQYMLDTTADDTVTAGGSVSDEADNADNAESAENEQAMPQDAPALFMAGIPACNSTDECDDGAPEDAAEITDNSSSENTDAAVTYSTISAGKPEVATNDVESEGAQAETTDDDPITENRGVVMSTRPAAKRGISLYSAHGFALEADDEIVEVPESDAKFATTAANDDEILSEYDDFLTSNALSPTSPQVILNTPSDAAAYIANYALPAPLFENDNFYALDITLSELEARLELCDISDYTVLSSDAAAQTVYLYFQ